MKTIWSPAPPADKQTKGASGTQATDGLAGSETQAPGLPDQGGGDGHHLRKMQLHTCQTLMQREAPALANLLILCGCNSSVAMMLGVCVEEGQFL